MKRKVLVLGASMNTSRYSNIAVQRLYQHGFDVIAIGNREGRILNVPIITKPPIIKDIDTITLYLSPANQKKYYDYILNLNPHRIIFNPGTENKELEILLAEKDIEVLHECTLVMLSMKVF